MMYLCSVVSELSNYGMSVGVCLPIDIGAIFIDG